MSSIINLFPTSICAVKINGFNNKNLKNYITEISKNNKSVKLTNIGGWQSENLSNDKNLQNIIKIIGDCVNKFADEIKLKTPQNLANIWANVNGYGHYNVPHAHPYSLLSGAYYVNVPKNSGKLIFLHPKIELFNYDWNDKNIKEYGENNCGEWRINPEEGLLIIFPNWATHLVEPNLNKKEKRISLSFNFYFKNDQY